MVFNQYKHSGVRLCPLSLHKHYSQMVRITFGMLGPVSFNLSLRDSSLVILCFSLLVTFAPAYLSTLGPKTGMRQMVQARYSFGFVIQAWNLLVRDC